VTGASRRGKTGTGERCSQLGAPMSAKLSQVCETRLLTRGGSASRRSGVVFSLRIAAALFVEWNLEHGLMTVRLSQAMPWAPNPDLAKSCRPVAQPGRQATAALTGACRLSESSLSVIAWPVEPIPCGWIERCRCPQAGRSVQRMTGIRALASAAGDSSRSHMPLSVYLSAA
jgi:hypothetical protein